MNSRTTRFLKAGVLYFAVVFGAGFLLGTVRVLMVVPHLGARGAELIELPVMLIVTIVSARWIVRELAVNSFSSRLAMGGTALGLLLLTEFSVVLWLRGLTIDEYLAVRDPVSATAYYLTLALFAVMPLLVARRPGHYSRRRRMCARFLPYSAKDSSRSFWRAGISCELQCQLGRHIRCVLNRHSPGTCERLLEGPLLIHREAPVRTLNSKVETQT